MMANPTLTNLRENFKKYAWDNSLDNTTIDFWLKDQYEDFRKELWDTRARGFLPIIIEQRPLKTDTNKWNYIEIPNTAQAWNLIKNNQLEFYNDTDNGVYKIFIGRGNINQTVIWMDEVTLPTVAGTESIYNKSICRAIVMYAVADYFMHIKSFEEEAMMKARADREKNKLLAGMRQEFIYNETDTNEEIQVNFQ